MPGRIWASSPYEVSSTFMSRTAARISGGGVPTRASAEERSLLRAEPAGPGSAGQSPRSRGQRRSGLLDLGAEPFRGGIADAPATPDELGDDRQRRVHVPVPVRGQADERDMAVHVPSFRLIT